MGRGGRAAYGPGGDRVAFARHVLEESPLADRPIAELQKHAEQRGLKTDGTRDDLLLVLRPYSKVRAVRVFKSLGERGVSYRAPTHTTFGKALEKLLITAVSKYVRLFGRIVWPRSS